MATSVPSNTLVPLSSLFPGAEAITPDIPPPLDIEKEDNNFIRSVMSTVEKFESSSPISIKNNNFGNLQYNKGGFAEQFGAVPDLDNPYKDIEGIQRFHAKFPDRDTGIEAAKVLAKDILKEVKGDPIKFAERWTGITDPNSKEYATVKNYAKEIDSTFLKNSEPVSLSSLVPLSPSTRPHAIEPGTVVPLEGLVHSPARDPNPPVKDPKSFFEETVEAITALGKGVPLGLVQGSETYARVADLVGFPGARDVVDYLDNIVKGYYENPQDYLEHSLMGGVSSMLNSIMTGAGGAVAGSFIGAGPWGTVAGYALSSGTLFSLAEYHRFMDDVVAFGRENKMDEEEIKQFKSESVPEAIVSAVAEGGIEFIQALVLGKVLGFTGASKTLTKPAKLKIKQMAFDFLKKLGITAPVEIGGEEITTIFQVLAKESANLPHPEMWEAMKQTFGPSAVQVFLMGFGGQMIQGRYADTSQNRDILKQQILDLNEKKGIDISEDQVDAFLVTVDFMAERKGINVGDFIGQLFADVSQEDPVEGELMQRMPDTFITKASKVIEETWDEEETSESALRKLKNGQVNKHEMEWFGVEDFINSISMNGDVNISKQEMLEYLSLIGTQAGVEEKHYNSKFYDISTLTMQELEIANRVIDGKYVSDDELRSTSDLWMLFAYDDLDNLRSLKVRSKIPNLRNIQAKLMLDLSNAMAYTGNNQGEIDVLLFEALRSSIITELEEVRLRQWLSTGLVQDKPMIGKESPKDLDEILVDLKIKYSKPIYDGLPRYQDMGVNLGSYSEYGEIVAYISNETLRNIYGIGGRFVIDDNFNSTIKHFTDIKNVFVFGRYTVRKNDKGEYLLWEESQSDPHQVGYAQGYATWEDSIEGNINIETLKLWARVVLAKFTNSTIEDTKYINGFKLFSMLELTGNLPSNLVQQSIDNFNEYSRLVKARKLPPPLPFKEKNIHLMAKRMIVEAIKKDINYVAWNTGENRIKVWGDMNLGWRHEGGGNIGVYFAKGKFPSVSQLISHADAKLVVLKNDINISEDDKINTLSEAFGHVGIEIDMAKGIFNKIMDSPIEGSLRPLEGLFTHIYDKMIPGIMKKITGEDIVEIKNDMYYPGKERTLGVATITETAGDVGPIQGIPITDAVRERFLKGQQHLFQGEKGSVQFLEDGRAVLRMAQGADVSTLFHELGHIIRRTLTPKELKEIEDWVGIGKDGVWTVAAEEKFARGFERWLRTGKTEREELQSTFKNISKWLKKVYTRIKGSPIEGKLSRDMRNFFDRLMEEPNLESIVNGRKVLLNLGGQFILEDEDDDISALIALIASPEFAARKFPVARDLIAKIIESEFKASGLSQEDYVEFEEAERHALSDLGRMAGNIIVKKLTPKRTRKQLEKVRGALEIITKGTDKEIKALQKESPGVYEAAKILRKYFDRMREDIKDYKKVMFIRTLPEKYSEGFEEAILIYVESGDISNKDLDRIIEKYSLEEGRFKDYISSFTEIDNWGIDDYITNMERGTIKLVDDEGNIKIIAMSKREAIRKAKQYLEDNPDVKSLRLDTSAMNFDPHAELSRIQYWIVFRKLADGFSKDMSSIKDELGKALGRVIKITPTHKFAGPLQKRKDILSGEMNILDVVYTYSYVIRKKIAIDEVVLEVRDKIGDLPKNVREMILNQLEYAKGKYSYGDRIVDDLFGKRFGLRPLLFTRGVGKIRKSMANLKLGYRPVASFINFVSGQGHTWVKFGITYMKKGRAFLKTNKGKDFIERQEKFLGTSFAIDTETKKTKRGFKVWQPLALFSAAELPNRHINVAAAYLYAKDQGMHEAEAELFARRSVRLIQFTYNATSLPAIMRSPFGKLVGQFKPYLVKEIEFIRGLRGTGQIMKYFGLQMALAGPRGMLWMIRSLPILGMLGLWDEVEEWMNKPHPEIPIVGDGIPTLSRGVVGLIGGDITMPATVQLPNRPEDWAGPFFSDLIRLYTEVGKPWMEGEKYIDMNMEAWLLRLAPATYYWDQLIQSIITEDDGWVRDKRSGNKLYQVSGNWDRLLLSMGVSPTKRSEAISAERLFKKEENIRNRNARKVLSKFIIAVKKGKDIPAEIMDDLLLLGVSRQTIRQAMIRKELPPNIRILRESRRLSRPRFMELYPE